MYTKKTVLFIVPNFQIRGSHVPMVRIANKMTADNIYGNVIYNIHPVKTTNNDLLNFINTDAKIYNNWGEIFTSTKIINLLPKKLLNKINLFIISFQFQYIKRKHNIDTINSHAFLADFFVENVLMKIKALKGIKYVSTWHGCYESTLSENRNEKTKKKFIKAIKQRFDKYDGIIYVSKKQKYFIDEVFKISDIKLKKIYYGIDTNLRQNTTTLKNGIITKNYDFVFGMVSAPFESKGWQILIEAFLQLTEETEKNIGLILVGLKDLSDGFKEKYSNPNIHYVKYTNIPLDYMSIMDVGVLPTSYPAENLPNVIIEYLKKAIPVISTDYAEIPYMLNYKSKYAGVVIPLVNGLPLIVDLKKAMKSYLDNVALYTEHKKNSKIVLNKKFDIKKITNEYKSFFNSI